jgi:hypothetical protein
MPASKEICVAEGVITPYFRRWPPADASSCFGRPHFMVLVAFLRFSLRTGSGFAVDLVSLPGLLFAICSGRILGEQIIPNLFLHPRHAAIWEALR